MDSSQSNKDVNNQIVFWSHVFKTQGGNMEKRKVKLYSKDESACSGKRRVFEEKQRLSNFNGVCIRWSCFCWSWLCNVEAKSGTGPKWRVGLAGCFTIARAPRDSVQGQIYCYRFINKTTKYPEWVKTLLHWKVMQPTFTLPDDEGHSGTSLKSLVNLLISPLWESILNNKELDNIGSYFKCLTK